MKFRLLFPLFIILIFSSCFQQNNGKQDINEHSNISATQNYIATDSTFGDLDNDQEKEKVIVYNTNKQNQNGIIRCLNIYKKHGTNWRLFYSTESAILEKQTSIVMDDFFIENGYLVINHYGGSNWKINIRHKYRYQEKDFKLIELHSFYGKLLEKYKTIDYNLETGKVFFSYDEETLINKEQIITNIQSDSFTHLLDTLPSLATFNFKESKNLIPKYSQDFYY